MFDLLAILTKEDTEADLAAYAADEAKADAEAAQFEAEDAAMMADLYTRLADEDAKLTTAELDILSNDMFAKRHGIK